MDERIYKYKVTVYRTADDDEHVYRGVVLAASFALATKKIVEAFEFKGENTHQYDCLICDVTIKEYVDDTGQPTDIYVFEEGEQ